MAIPGNVSDGAAAEASVSAKLDAVLEHLARVEARLAAIEGGVTAREVDAATAATGQRASEVGRELIGVVELALAGMSDEMLKGLVRRVSVIAELALDPGVQRLLTRLESPDVLRALERVTEPQVLEPLEGVLSALALAQSGLTDDMIKGLVRKVSTLAELVLDPFVLDAIQVLARALKAGQAQYPDVKVPPVGGIFGALRAANDADTRRVMAFALAVMQNLGHEFA